MRLSEEQAMKICDLRKLLETFALKTSIFTIEKNELKNLLDETKKTYRIYTNTKDRTLFDKTDKKLHWLIISHCDNEYLNKMFAEIFDLVNIVHHLQHPVEDAFQEHLNLIQAMLKRDLNASLNLLEYHLDQVKERTGKAVRENFG